MTTRGDRWALGLACLCVSYIALLLLARLPRGVTVELELEDRVLRATATLEGTWAGLGKRSIWAPELGRTPRILTVDLHADLQGTSPPASSFLASRDESIRIEITHDHGVVDGLVRGAFLEPESGSCLVPLSFLGLVEEDSSGIVYRARDEGTRVHRGLVIHGAGWVRSSGPVDVLAHEAVATHAGEAARLIGRGLGILGDWGAPPGFPEPLVVLLPKGPREVATDFRLQEKGIYVVEVGERGLLVSTVFRDLARAACERVAMTRPPAERTIWRSLSSVLAVRIAEECSVSGVEGAIDALESRYRVAPREESLFDVPADPDSRWRLENIVGPVYWNAMLRTWPVAGEPLRDLFAAVLGRDEGLPEAVAHSLGGEIAAHVEAFLMEGRIQVGSTTGDHWPAASDLRQPGLREKAACSIVYSGVNGGFLDNCGCSITQHGGLRAREEIAVASGRASCSP